MRHQSNSEKGKCMKKGFGCLFLLLIAAVSVWSAPSLSFAASATVELTKQNQEIEEGKEFSVICRVNSDDGFNDVEMNVLYDASRMEFIKGGKKVSGGNGVLRISSTGNEDTVKKRTYSLKFKALKAGDASVELDDNVFVTDSAGAKLSISSNQLIINIVLAQQVQQQAQEQQDPPASSVPAPAATPEVVLSTNNKLNALKFDCLSMTPEFDTNVLEYTVNVDCNTDILYFNYTAASSKAKVRIKDNEELLTGENTVKVVVTAESGDKRVFKIKVIKESESETKVREQAEKGSSDITFSVYEKDGAIFIQNQYQFEVVDVPEEDIIPSGYVKTSLELDGKNVTAYTMENDLDNNYLLMYLKGVASEPTLYQYDRQEKTLQRYTGTMVQKVNKSGNVAEEAEFVPGTWLYAVIVVLIVIIIALLIIMLNMILKKKFGRGKKELGDMDF